MNKTLLLPLFASAIASPCFAQSTADQQYHWRMMHDWGGGWGMVLGPLYMIFWLALLVAAVVLVIRWLVPGSAAPSSVPRARQLLDERYANGEIDHDELRKTPQDAQFLNGAKACNQVNSPRFRDVGIHGMSAKR